ncbi:MAG: hypothetical protein GXP11_03265, partial [Gammaproteobacteria bacterium]|nr:hypothetical protein [Gammaproteobacteria bacterium]
RGQSVGLPAGVTRLADPILTLKSGSTTIDSSDNWQDHATAAIVSMRGRAPNAPSDAALYACLSPGAYTALLRGVGGTSNGVGIIEVFDEDYGTPFLANISTRAFVGTGNKAAIGGFVIRGKQSKQVLIRGRGPTVGVPSGSIRLPDPTLTLRSGTTTLAINDNWGQAANSAAISATGKAPANAMEAAILITLPPGTYTAILKGANQSTGIGIVEVIDESGGSIASN